MFKSLSANLISLKLFYNTEGQKSILHSQENTLQSYFGFQTYLATPNQFTEDVDFSSDGQHIIGARFMIQGAHIYDTNQEQIFVEELRAVCHNSQFNVTVFHPFFIFFDQVIYLRGIAIWSGVA